MSDDLLARLEELEIRAAYQEDHIDALNRTVSEQHQSIQDLTLAIQRLKLLLDESISVVGTGKIIDEKPPHY